MTKYINNLIVDADIRSRHVTFWFSDSVSGYDYFDMNDLAETIKNLVCVKYIERDGESRIIQEIGVILDHCVISRTLQDYLDNKYNIESKILPCKRLKNEMKVISYSDIHKYTLNFNKEGWDD